MQKLILIREGKSKMKKVIPGFLVVGFFILLISVSIGGCSDTPCDFDLNAFFNGTSILDQNSEWDCKRGGETVFTLGLFGDLTGTRSDIGDFVFDRQKCRVLNFENEAGSGKLKNLQGSSNLGTLAFKQVSDDFGDTEVVCNLVEF